MKIHESEGVRTFRRDLRSVRIAQAIKTAMGGLTELYLSDVVRMIDWGAEYVSLKGEPAAYQATQRAMPFEIGGVIYRVFSEEQQTRVYQKTKKVVAAAGKLEDFEPRREKAKTTIDKRIDERLAELAQWTNVFALREEARTYIEAMESRFEARLSTLERKLTDG